MSISVISKLPLNVVFESTCGGGGSSYKKYKVILDKARNTDLESISYWIECISIFLLKIQISRTN